MLQTQPPARKIKGVICQTSECGLDAAVTVLWPGSGPVVMCSTCAQQASTVADVIGFKLLVMPLAVATEPMALEVEAALVPVRHLALGIQHARCGAEEGDRTSSIALTTCKACLKEAEVALGLRPVGDA